jgi:hypothetical protein
MRPRRRKASWSDNAIALGCFAGFVLLPFAAWSQHLFTCGAEDRWEFATFGALVFPVGVAHGVGVWVGVW